MQDSAQIQSVTAQLVTRARTGDGDAYRELLARLAPAVRAYARRRLAQREAVEDFTQDALLALTERLNPATWTDADQIAAGLQQASEALERLSRVLSRRRRRPRRRSGDAGSPAPGAASSES